VCLAGILAGECCPQWLQFLGDALGRFVISLVGPLLIDLFSRSLLLNRGRGHIFFGSLSRFALLGRLLLVWLGGFLNCRVGRPSGLAEMTGVPEQYGRILTTREKCLAVP